MEETPNVVSQETQLDSTDEDTGVWMNTPWSFVDSDFDYFSEDVFLSSENSKKNMWAVSWSDLMMTMFIFFVVLYVYPVGRPDLLGGPGSAIKKIQTGSRELEDVNREKMPSEIFDQVKQMIHDEFVATDASVTLISDKAVKIVIAGELLFDIGQAELKNRAKGRLGQIARILQGNSYIINVVGHTDSVPNHSIQFPTNWELSTARACTVARYLIESQGVPENRFFVSGYSRHRPVLPNNNRYNRAINRRVEIILIKEKPQMRSDLGL